LLIGDNPYLLQQEECQVGAYNNRPPKKQRLVEVPIYLVTSYYVRAEKVAEYQKWLSSSEAQRLNKQLEDETGIKYLNTYFSILGFGDYDREEGRTF
jgi:hypothetical protein